MKMRTLIAVISVAAAITFSFPVYPAAQEEKPSGLAQADEQKEVVVRKEITGTISGMSPSFLAVTFGKGEADGAALEMAFNVGKDVRVAHKNSMKEIGFGDTVTVTYDEITKTTDEGRTLTRREIRMVTFVKAAPKSPEPDADTPGTLQSQGSEELAPLTIKGPKKE